MDSNRQVALLALRLVQGTQHRDEIADGLLIEAFDDVADAARAHAYLSGFLLEALAEARRESVDETADHVEQLIRRV